ncbi:TonB-dependent receptor plug domain-containing protein [Pseudoalteromonas sp. SSM20]|uniref:TonB-dependent receptor plug domain-containing protein n=1 Tax=Pseudoalteromonas sp. SSM20 TaxID=3139394 RepID=UPI003BA9B7C8
MRGISGLSLLLFCSVAHGDEIDLYDLSIDELLVVKVTSATKTETPLYLAPGTVNVFNQQDISALAVPTIAELADISPSYSTYSLYGERILTTRGQKAGSFENNKHLMLLDGIEINHARANKAPIEYELPLFFVDQVEMLTGPASSLYGDGAFYGVVSLVSKPKSNSVDVLLRHDSQDGVLAGFQAATDSKLGQSSITVSRSHKESSEQYVGPNFSELQRYYDEQSASMVYFRHQVNDEKIGKLRYAFIRLARDSGLGEHWQNDYSVPENQIKWRTQVNYLQWVLPINEQLNLDLNYSENKSLESGLAVNLSRAQKIAGSSDTFDQYHVDVKSKKVELNLNWQINNSDNLIVGVNSDWRVDRGGYFASNIALSNVDESAFKKAREASDDVKLLSYLAQYQFTLKALKNNYFTLGGRYDSGEYKEDSFAVFSPRASWVWSISERLTSKLLYNTALRAPGLKEYLLNDETRSFVAAQAFDVEGVLSEISASLSPEEFSSIELALNYQQDTWQVGANLFSNLTEKALDGKPVEYQNTEGEIVRRNLFSNRSDELRVNGVELNFSYHLFENVLLSAYATQLFSSDTPQEIIQDLPKRTWQINANWSLGVFNSVIIYRNQSDYEHSEFNNAQLDYALKAQLSSDSSITFKATNLLDEETFYPVSGVAKIPMMQRSFSVNFNFNF